MRALIIGGSRFVGAAISDELLSRGAEVTLFNRGETQPGGRDGTRHVSGDRMSDLGKLDGERFDVIFDSCGYQPEAVKLSAELARSAGAFYVFVSTCSVYATRSTPGFMDEGRPLADIDPAFERTAGENYGAAKVLCELALVDALGDGVAIPRPGLVVGPNDYTDRFPYWAARLAEPGPVLCPGGGDDPTQMIDARDFAAFCVELGSRHSPGTFNATGPADRQITFADFIEAVTPEAASPELVWAPADFLETNEVAPWKDMPCWIPADHDAAGILEVDVSRALELGFETRPLAETADDTRAWLASEGRSLPMAAGLPGERERELIELLRR